MKMPPVEPPLSSSDGHLWWEAWVDLVRNQPRGFDKVGESAQSFFWGEHLFIGSESHNNLSRSKRAVPKEDRAFSDAIEYEEVEHLRTWDRTKPSSLFLHERILAEHCYIVGPSGSGKSSLGIMPLLVQLMRGAKTKSEAKPDPYPVVILDLKGDAALFQTIKLEAESRHQGFRFFTTERGAPTYRFNPFRGFDRGSRSVAQLCQLILDALNLNHGKGYGRSYYTERSRNVLSRTLKRNRNIQSFDELHEELGKTVARADVRTKGDAFELLSVIEMLKEYRQLVTDPDETISATDGIIFMPAVLEHRQVAYFWLPAALESISVGEIAKLVLFNLRVAAQDWKRAHPGNTQNVILVIDELQRVAGENLQGILQDARSFGIHAILANQSLSDLKSPTGFDLAPTIMTNTRVKFFFTSPSESECYLYVERGKGFTEARQFPQKGNPWLKDLAPEEFAYHVKLAWPFSLEEYQRREALPMPTWEDVPGGDFYTEEIDEFEEDEEPPISDILPRPFKLIEDEEWEQQVATIQALFESEDGESSDSVQDLSPEQIQKMQREIVATIQERGPDRSRCILNRLFENYLSNVEVAPSWRDLWKSCWSEPLDTRRGGDLDQAKVVRQAVTRVREILDRYFASEAGTKWPSSVTVERNEYRLVFKRGTKVTEESDEDRFPDADYPEADEDDVEE